MRFLVFAAILLSLPLVAGAKAARKPTNAPNGPAKVITFSCRENPDEPVLGLGVAYLRIDPKDSTLASVSLSLFTQTQKKAFTNKTYQGSAAAVPGGYTFSINGHDSFMLHLHPHETTNLPGIHGRPLACESTASISSTP